MHVSATGLLNQLLPYYDITTNDTQSVIMQNDDFLISVANDQVWAAHLCYLLASEKFGFPSDEKTKMTLIGVDHR